MTSYRILRANSTQARSDGHRIEPTLAGNAPAHPIHLASVAAPLRRSAATGVPRPESSPDGRGELARPTPPGYRFIRPPPYARPPDAALPGTHAGSHRHVPGDGCLSIDPLPEAMLIELNLSLKFRSPTAPERSGSTPTIDHLSGACACEFERLGGETLRGAILRDARQGRIDPRKVQTLNGLAALSTFKIVRAHFKGRLKSSDQGNGGRDLGHDKPVPGILRQPLSQAAPAQLADVSLEQYASEGVGNCNETAALSATLLRRAHLHADVWAYRNAKVFSHLFCIVGQVPHAQDAARPAARLDGQGDTGADHLWIVDPWSGICCPSREFDARFETKMSQWSVEGKTVSPDSVRWLDPTDLEWLQSTVRSPWGKKKLPGGLIAGYAPEEPGATYLI